MEKDEKVILEIENIIRTKQAAERLKIAESTIRKYAQTLEKNTGYTFKSDENGRVFSEDDIDTLRTIKQVKDEFGVSLQRAVDIVATRKQRSTQTVSPEKVRNDGESKAIQTRHNQDAVALINEIRNIAEYMIQEVNEAKEEMRQEVNLAKEEIKKEVREERNNLEEFLKRQEERELSKEGYLSEEIKILRSKLNEMEKEVAASKEKRWYEFWK